MAPGAIAAVKALDELCHRVRLMTGNHLRIFGVHGRSLIETNLAGWTLAITPILPRSHRIPSPDRGRSLTQTNRRDIFASRFPPKIASYCRVCNRSIGRNTHAAHGRGFTARSVLL